MTHQIFQKSQNAFALLTPLARPRLTFFMYDLHGNCIQVRSMDFNSFMSLSYYVIYVIFGSKITIV